MIVDYTNAMATYARQDIGAKMGMGEQPAIIVVDYTYGFTSPDSPMGVDMSDAVEATADLLAVGREAGVPVCYTINAFREDMADAGVWPRKFPSLRNLIEGNRWTQIDDRVAPAPEDLVFVKRYPSAFFGTTLFTALTQRRVDTLIITGTTTSGCIRATTVDALQYGFRPIVAEDCVADRDPAPHQANLFDLRSKYADVEPSASIADSLRSLERPVQAAPAAR